MSKINIGGRSFCNNNLIDDRMKGKDFHNISNENFKILTPLVAKSKDRPIFKWKQSKVEPKKKSEGKI